MNQFAQQLQRLGLSAAALARLVDIPLTEAEAWVAGHAAVPGPVKSYVRVLALLDPVSRRAETGRLNRRGRLDDGVYRLDYKGLYNSGICLLHLSGGRLVGIDTGGGSYHGTYDAAERGQHRLDVRLRIPPGQILVTGAKAGLEGGEISICATLDTPDPAASAVVDVGGRPVEVSLAYLCPLPVIDAPAGGDLDADT